MKKTLKETVKRDTETMADSIGLGLSYGNSFGIADAPRQLTSVMDAQPSPAEKIEMKR